MNIIQAIGDPGLFKPFFKDPGTWHAWEVFLRGLFGIPIEGEADKRLFQNSTGLEAPPADRTRESFVICGRRSGKSFISAVVAVFLGCFKDWRPFLSAGERGMIFIIAVDKGQAAIIKRYVSGLLHGCRILRAMVEKETREEIQLRNRVGIMVKTCSFRSLRGYTVLCAILEEIAFWRSEESANPDREVLAALRPALATVPDSLLLGISTPYSRAGVLFDQFKAGFGKPEGPLVWKAPTKIMNPTIPRETIDQAFREDPEAAAAEWGAEFRSDISAFISAELIQAVTVPGRYELQRIKDVSYFAYLDPSGGRQDSFTLAVAHAEKNGKVVLDVLRERRPPFKPQAVVQEFSDILKSFKCSSAGSDRYAGEWVTAAFREHGVDIENSDLAASELYLELLPMISNGSVELLDSKRLTAQLAGLERRTRSGGKDLITHYAGGHDDLAVAVAGACFRASGAGKDGGAYIGVSTCTPDILEEDDERGTLDDWMQNSRKIH